MTQRPPTPAVQFKVSYDSVDKVGIMAYVGKEWIGCAVLRRNPNTLLWNTRITYRCFVARESHYHIDTAISLAKSLIIGRWEATWAAYHTNNSDDNLSETPTG